MTPAKLHALLGTWGAPPDGVAIVALALSFAIVIAGTRGHLDAILGFGPSPSDARTFLWLSAFASALLSVLWVAHYLRGGPRIVDATTYFLQGRALSHGSLAWPVLDPTASFRGRFLDYRAATGADGSATLGGIFPPGYPLLLALGFVVHAPMLVGPLLAAALVFATYRLARTFAEVRGLTRLAEPIARTAALLSVACGALRYHTADTMSHGATALFVVLALDAAFRERAVIVGLAVGAILATRPVSAVPVAVVCATVLWRGAKGGHRLHPIGRAGLGALPGLLLLLASQRAVTGSVFDSTQRMYYALSDGPPNCFRWGMGSGIGCLYEHGEFVKARLPHGHGLLSMAGTTLRRLRLHLSDVANFEPLFALVVAPLFLRAPSPACCRRRPERAAVALVALHVCAYAPFYFDGDYPGGGARFFADLLPVEHALVALALALIATRAFAVASSVTLGLALAGFAVHASFDHLRLAERDGGRPMFEPDVLARANVTTGLVFVDTDHGFALGHDPFATGHDDVLVARQRHDDRDRLLFERLGRPPTYLYRFALPPQASGPLVATASVTPWTPAPTRDTVRFEAEAEWPALSQSGGFAVPAYVSGCGSPKDGPRALVLTPTSTSESGAVAEAAIEVPVPAKGRYEVGLHIVHGARVPFTEDRFFDSSATQAMRSPAPPGGVRGKARVVGNVDGTFATFSWEEDTSFPHCTSLTPVALDLVPPSVTLLLEAHDGPVAVDAITLHRITQGK